MPFHQEIVRPFRFRNPALILALVLVVASVMLPISVEGSGTTLCCSDEWQVVGICAPSERMARYCADSSCQECGAMFCYTETIRHSCYH